MMGDTPTGRAHPAVGDWVGTLSRHRGALLALDGVGRLGNVFCGGIMDQSLLNVGFGNTVVADRVVAIVSPNSAPMKRLKDEAKDDRRLIDATHGRKTRSVIVMDSNHIVLSAIQTDTIAQRFATLQEAE